MNDTSQMKGPHQSEPGGEPGSEKPSGKALWIGVAAAAVVAVVVLVVAVLPAEFGVDPTGAGEATGLSGLADAGELSEAERGALRGEGVFTTYDEAMRYDRREFEIPSYGSLEFKYTLEEGAPLVFNWTSTAPVTIDMHAHPFDGGEALTESYSQGESEGESGVYIAQFTGIHGWYWQNRTLDPVTVTINAAGPFTETTIFDDLGETPEAAAPVD